jgi:hypothetical protein
VRHVFVILIIAFSDAQENQGSTYIYMKSAHYIIRRMGMKVMQTINDYAETDGTANLSPIRRD